MIFCQYSTVVEILFPSDEATSNLTFDSAEALVDELYGLLES